MTYDRASINLQLNSKTENSYTNTLLRTIISQNDCTLYVTNYRHQRKRINTATQINIYK